MKGQSFVATGKLTIKAIQDTTLKRLPVQSYSSALKSGDKYVFTNDSELDINWYKCDGDHVKVSLIKAINGYHDWYCYCEHVEALEDGRVKDSFDTSVLINKHQAEFIFGNAIRDSELKDLNSCLQTFEISTLARMSMFLAQVGHESCGLKWMQELSSGAAYERREDLGNIYPGDGKRFKG